MTTSPSPGPTSGASEERATTRPPSRARYSLALGLLVVGMVASLALAITASAARDDHAKGFARADVPGVLTISVDQTGTYNVFAEGTTCLDYPNCHGQIYPVTVEVTGPVGRPVAVTAWSGPTYTNGGTEGTGVATFTATRSGTYRVATSTGDYTGGQFTVGRPFPAWTDDRLGWVPLLFLGGAGVVLAVVTFVKRRRGGVAAR